MTSESTATEHSSAPTPTGGEAGQGRPSSTDTGTSSGHDKLALRLGELARTLEQEHDLQGTLDAIVHAAVQTIPGVQHASISTVSRRREVTTQASTDDLPIAVDQAQYETNQGPCMDTLYERVTERLSDLTTETRWPAFIARARALGVGSMLSIQLYVHGDDLGALNLISTEPHAFDDESEHVGLLFASHAAVAMAGAQHEQQLRHGMARRDIIGQAKGILMERFHLDAEQAFRLLARLSQDTNIPLHDLAAQLSQT